MFIININLVVIAVLYITTDLLYSILVCYIRLPLLLYPATLNHTFTQYVVQFLFKFFLLNFINLCIAISVYAVIQLCSLVITLIDCSNIYKFSKKYFQMKQQKI